METQMSNQYELKLYLEFLYKITTNSRKIRLQPKDLNNIFEPLMPEEKYEKYSQMDLKDKAAYIKSFLSDELLKLKKVTKSRLCKKIEIFADLFELENIDIEIFKIIIYYKLSKDFENLFDALRNSGRTFVNASYGLCEDSISLVLDLNIAKVSKILNKLKSKGILTRNNDINLYEDVENLFLDYEILTKKQIIKKCLGKSIKSKLSLKDFAHLKEESENVVEILQASLRNEEKGINILFWGSVGTGKTELSKIIAKVGKLNIYEVNYIDSADIEMSRRERLSDLQRKQQILKSDNKSILLFDEAEDVMNNGFKFGESSSKVFLNRLLENNTTPVIWTTNDIYSVDPAFLRRMTYAVEFKVLSESIRLNLWKKEISKNKLKIAESKLVELNSAYNVPPSLIANAVKTTKLTNGNQNDFEKYVANIAKIINKGQDVKINNLYKVANYNDNLVNTDLNISTLTNRITEIGKLNFSLCLYGQSGTGKSAYARFLAKELNIKVIIKQASDLMSPYVGETEIKIAKAFEEAKQEKAMLIIDEADSFLQSRQNAQHSWEISQVNQMLTSMENHPYPFVCSTNLVDILDEASLRRFTFKIKFDFLKQEQVKTAFKHFFNLKLPEDINPVYGITIGDFALVNKKAEYLGYKNDASELYKLLHDEVKMKSKDIVGHKFGF